MTTTGPDQQPDLLRFSRQVYAQPGIQALCLRLQDEHDIDVVLLLMCCWHGCYRGVLTGAQLAQATTFSDTWRAQLVKPLRQTRRWLKSHPAEPMNIPVDDQEALRQGIKALELEAEFMQLRALAGLFANTQKYTDPLRSDMGPAAAIGANVLRYFRDRTGHANLDEQTLASLIHASLAQLPLILAH